MICPCRKCENQGCGSYHDSCEKYKEWSAERKENNRTRIANQDVRQLSRDHEIKYRKNLKGRR